MYIKSAQKTIQNYIYIEIYKVILMHKLYE